jgi:hypothetical protein
MSKHTRGPWIAYETQIVKARVEIEQSHGTMKTNEYPIAAVNANLPEQEALANARLIAAAPEMLAALEFIASDGCLYGDIEECTGCSACVAADAIARATE